MTKGQWEELEEKTLSTIQVCLATNAFREVLDQTTMENLWLRLEAIHKTKNLANKIGTTVYFLMAEGTPIQNI